MLVHCKLFMCGAIVIHKAPLQAEPFEIDDEMPSAALPHFVARVAGRVLGQEVGKRLFFPYS